MCSKCGLINSTQSKYCYLCRREEKRGGGGTENTKIKGYDTVDD